ncbi:pyruvate/2-oxoglutarate dehydrogenase complex dihydrolipoamide dehydrogenase (E3) component [Nocardia tenerifensis]|uniref:Pyruvate/2-oxoglutarate dehydrogenase complex dihydrolipoamide dehydrogenase (E3) component n=2 Tax=Nocardia tenerifensis TaxID=228006 RepID=A0A318K9B3_9NOCA|nr:FAD/NAD(P)-binding oxidoreductase [Nocardia tenerifensis]PXX69314.1 pyruvate/2-oxoglutarate dehydrogenase complex dihydrolipoamide dehydrogenase (E3) component [Nocardia tenerifensis]
MSRHVVVIGGGPAGTAAADAALRHGATVTLIDSNEALGGQYNRRVPAAYGVGQPLTIGHGYAAAARRARLLIEHPRCTYLPWAAVYQIERHLEGGCPAVRLLIGAEGDRREHRVVQGDALVIATGAYDRVCPFPGWDLPGVYTAGAAQTLAKTQRLLVGRSVLVSGTGPFLLPVAQSLADNGARVRAVLEANPGRAIVRRWTAEPWQLRHSAGKALELFEYVACGVRHRIPLRTAHAVVAVAGDGRAEEATVARLDADWTPIPGSHTTVPVDAVAVSHGFTPQHELAVAAGARLTADGFVLVDDEQRTSAEYVWAAGEITGIGGAQVAAVEGAVAGLAAAGATADRALRSRHRTAEQFVARLAAAHPIRPGVLSWSRPDTVVCRCEGTTRGELTSAWSGVAGDGYRAAKLATRAGLGPCQGRMCAANIEALRDRPYADTAVDKFSATTGLAAATPTWRPLAAPVRLRELAELDDAASPKPPAPGASAPSTPRQDKGQS